MNVKRQLSHNLRTSLQNAKTFEEVQQIAKKIRYTWKSASKIEKMYIPLKRPYDNTDWPLTLEFGEGLGTLKGGIVTIPAIMVNYVRSRINVYDNNVILTIPETVKRETLLGNHCAMVFSLYNPVKKETYSGEVFRINGVVTNYHGNFGVKAKFEQKIPEIFRGGYVQISLYKADPSFILSLF